MPLLASAEIYKSRDADGNAVFSDTPRPGASKITLPPPTTYTPPSSPPPAGASTGTSVSIANYATLRIVNPSQGETIWDNNGEVVIGLEVAPAVDVQAGHKLVVELDGNKLSSTDNIPEFKLTDVDRGAHTVRAKIVDATGRELLGSENITFYLKRASVLLRRQRATPPLSLPSP